MSKNNVEVTVSTVIEAPKVLIDSIKASDKTEANHRKATLQMARGIRKFAIDELEKGTKDSRIKMVIAAAIATAKGLEVQHVVATPAKGGNASAYTLLSTLTSIALPKDAARAERIDTELAKPDEETTFSNVLKASRAERAPGGASKGGKGKDKDNAPLTLDTLEAAIGALVAKAIEADIPEKDVAKSFAAIVKDAYSAIEA